MRRVTLAALTVALVLPHLPARAQVVALPGAAQNVVTAKPVLSATAIRPGETIPAAVVLTIQKGWHMNAHQPTLDYLIPTTVALTLPHSVTAGEMEYPAPASLKVSFSPAPLAVYEGEAVVRFPLTVAKDVRPGSFTIRGKVNYQPCNEAQCAPPAEVSFTLPVRVAGPGEAVSPANASVFQAPQSPASPPAASAGGGYADVLATRGWLAFLALVFLGGLALNLTPCVYPMMAVTVSIFGARSGEPRGQVIRKALVYVLGMATMYTALGVTAALTGQLFGSALQSVWVQAGIAAFLLALSLGMFGVYTLQAPPKLSMALGGVNRTGSVGLYLSGLVVGVFAAPCVGPVVLGLLAMVGQRHDVAFGSAVFFTLAMGLGAPYIVLASSTRLLDRLPKSGGWMETVKHVFGVILVAVAARYLALAFAREVVDLVIPTAIVLGALYLAFLDRHAPVKPSAVRTRQALGVTGVALGLWLGAGAWSRVQGGQWPLYSDAALAQAATSGQPVVMDFTASWCAECRELDARTFHDPAVQRQLSGFRKLRVEMDGANKAEAPSLQRRWGVQGLPAVVFLDASGHEVTSARVNGFVPEKEFLARVAQVRPQIARR